MSELAPSDIAVVLRSIPRRVREAELAAEDEPLPPEMLAELDAAVQDAARQLGVPPTGDRDSVAAAAAERIGHVPAPRWTEESLGRLRESARMIGAILRRLEAFAQSR